MTAPAFSTPRPQTTQVAAIPPSVQARSTGRGVEKLHSTKQIPFDIIPPHDVEIERCALGSMLIDSIAAEYAAEFLTSEHFYAPRNRRLFEKMREVMVLRKALDETILVANLRPPNNTDEIKNYIGKLIIDTPSAANIEGYCATLAQLRHERARLAFALKILADVTKGRP